MGPQYWTPERQDGVTLIPRCLSYSTPTSIGGLQGAQTIACNGGHQTHAPCEVLSLSMAVLWYMGKAVSAWEEGGGKGVNAMAIDR